MKTDHGSRTSKFVNHLLVIPKFEFRLQELIFLNEHHLLVAVIQYRRSASHSQIE